jgi:hypothetical protein
VESVARNAFCAAFSTPIFMKLLILYQAFISIFGANFCPNLTNVQKIWAQFFISFNKA